LHLSGISLAISAVACDTCLEAIAIARAAGVLVAFDTNLRLRLWPLARARMIIDAAAAMADIVLPSLDDSRQLLAVEAPDLIVDHYLRQGAGVVALKMGADGALVATPERRQRLDAHRVQAVDATGAGDTFDGAFLAEYIRTGDPFAAGRRANVAAALATTGFGAVAPMPTREAVDAALGGSAA
jgi:2-dehydro-3-deoxygluconokinase